MIIRKINHTDREKLCDIIYRTDNFTDVEKKVALELIDDALDKHDSCDYYVNLIEDNGSIKGYYCCGERPLTIGTYDLYWIIVEPEMKGKGYGSKLIDHFEKFVKDMDGRLLILETSGKEQYLPTLGFYLKKKYTILTTIKDFYTLNDDLIMLYKYI